MAQNSEEVLCLDKKINPLAVKSLVIMITLRIILKEVEINFRRDDPMEWWRKHELYFPQVAKLARKYLATSASVHLQNGFSTAKKLTPDK